LVSLGQGWAPTQFLHITMALPTPALLLCVYPSTKHWKLTPCSTDGKTGSQQEELLVSAQIVEAAFSCPGLRPHLCPFPLSAPVRPAPLPQHLITVTFGGGWS
jgi:hypothetical protein